MLEYAKKRNFLYTREKRSWISERTQTKTQKRKMTQQHKTIQLSTYKKRVWLSNRTPKSPLPPLTPQSPSPTLVKANNKIYEDIDTKNISLVTLCCLSNGYGNVTHDTLIRECENFFVDPFWFKNYLSKRTQSVRMGTCISNKYNATYGVLQGSVLGPTLLSIYVNDLSYHIKDCLIIQYADDVQFVLPA